MADNDILEKLKEEAYNSKNTITDLNIRLADEQKRLKHLERLIELVEKHGIIW